MKKTLIIVETPVEQEIISMCLGHEYLVVYATDRLRVCSWTPFGLAWRESDSAWMELLQSITHEIDTVIIGMKSNDNSELQGMFALEDASRVLRPENHPGLPLVFKRMRFDSLTKDTITSALAQAGDHFDERAMERAMLSAYAGAQDVAYYAGFDLNMSDYRQPEVRLALHWLDEKNKPLRNEEGDWLKEVWCEVETNDGVHLKTFIPVTSSTLSEPMRMDADMAKWNADLLQENRDLRPFANSELQQDGSAYPATTTARFVGTVIDQLGITPDGALQGLQGMYAIGAVTTGDLPFVPPEEQDEQDHA